MLVSIRLFVCVWGFFFAPSASPPLICFLSLLLNIWSLTDCNACSVLRADFHSRRKMMRHEACIGGGKRRKKRTLSEWRTIFISIQQLFPPLLRAIKPSAEIWLTFPLSFWHTSGRLLDENAEHFRAHSHIFGEGLLSQWENKYRSSLPKIVYTMALSTSMRHTGHHFTLHTLSRQKRHLRPPFGTKYSAFWTMKCWN